MIKQLAALLFVAMGLMVCATTASAQICVPDSTQDSIGVYPPVLPTGTVNQAYETTITAVIPKVYSIPQGSFEICAARISSATALDSTGATVGVLGDIGLAYECNYTDCEIVVDHNDTSALTFGCIVINGMPSTSFDSVTVAFGVDLGNVVAGTCVTGLADFPLSYTIAFPVSTTTSIAGELRENLHVAYLPTQQLQVSFETPQADIAGINVIDLQGRRVAQVPMGGQGHQTVLMPTTGWAGGIYVVQITDRSGQVLLNEKVAVQP